MTQITLTGAGKPSLSHSELATTWYPALVGAGAARASCAVVGDSITAGYLSTDWDVDSYVSILRSLLQADYGNGGEGFLTAYHDYDITGGGDGRWTMTGTWPVDFYADAKTGWGAVASRRYCSDGTLADQAAIDFSGDSIQVMYPVNYSQFPSDVSILVDDILEASIDEFGDGDVTGNLITWGNIATITGLANMAHTIKVRNNTNLKYVTVEGVRPLIGTSGIVIDRLGKGWMQAYWLGTGIIDIGLSAYSGALAWTATLDEDLFIIALGINDYLHQVTLNNFQTALENIVNRFKVLADTVILAMPQPNSSLAIPYSDYVSRMSTVATATGCLFLNVRERWGDVYKAAWMGDANHPNDFGHTDIGQFIYDEIKL